MSYVNDMKRLNALNVFGETYEDHKKRCDGCPSCEMYRVLEKQLKEQHETEIAGVSGKQISDFQDKFYMDDSLERWFPKGTELVDRHGILQADVYLVCHFELFSDKEICEYFGLTTKKLQKLRLQAFRWWNDKELREKYLEELEPRAMSKYKLDNFKKFQNSTFLD